MSVSSNYIAALLKPPTVKPASSRKLWGIDLEGVWLPFFMASNVEGQTNIPSEALGAPLRLGYDKDGEVRFSQSGRPSFKVASELSEQVNSVKGNIMASLVQYTGQVVKSNKDGYAEEAQKAHNAGQDILTKDANALQKAIDDMETKAATVHPAIPSVPVEQPAEEQAKEPVAA